jgi:hypothetical protein
MIGLFILGICCGYGIRELELIHNRIGQLRTKQIRADLVRRRKR